MSLLPKEVTRATVEHEFAAVQAWAARHGWSVNLDLEHFVLTVDTDHPADGSPLKITAGLEDYKGLPPAWRFVDPATGEETKQAYPSPGRVQGGSSIFHGKPCLCAPFNRLAFKTEDGEYNGPHRDWGQPTAWLDVDTTNVVRAVDLGSMLAVIRLHLNASPGRMS